MESTHAPTVFPHSQCKAWPLGGTKDACLKDFSKNDGKPAVTGAI